MTSSPWDQSGQYVAVPTTDETIVPTDVFKTDGKFMSAPKQHLDGLPSRSSCCTSAYSTAKSSWRGQWLEHQDGLPGRQSRGNSREVSVTGRRPIKCGFLCRTFLYIVVLLSFVGVGILAYEPIEGWSWAECLFFSVEVVTAVGWGSVVPKTDTGKLFTSAYILAAMLVMAFVVCQLMDFIVESALDDLMDWMERKVVRKYEDLDSPWANFRQRCFMLAFTAIGGFFFFWKIDGMTPTDSLYFCVVSMTTIGFGDVLPSTVKGKIFCCFWVFLTVGCAASCMGAYTKARATRHGELMINKQLKVTDLKKMDGNRDGKVDRAEFMMHVLIESKLITREHVSTMYAAFDEFDCDGSGLLDQADLIASGSFQHAVGLVVSQTHSMAGSC
mmetsp:Transcript_8201/g.15498  ORF Transcript_8201/g.15498 Transcript_8201/m.15498 type:complete len:386 (-) Transcript_8201:86-1243(-)